MFIQTEGLRGFRPILRNSYEPTHNGLKSIYARLQTNYTIHWKYHSRMKGKLLSFLVVIILLYTFQFSGTSVELSDTHRFEERGQKQCCLLNRNHYEVKHKGLIKSEKQWEFYTNNNVLIIRLQNAPADRTS